MDEHLTLAQKMPKRSLYFVTLKAHDPPLRLRVRKLCGGLCPPSKALQGEGCAFES